MTTQIDQPAARDARAEQPPTITGRVVGFARDGARYLADLIDRIVNGFKGIAQLAPIVVLGVGCETSAVDAVPLPAVKVVSAPVDAGTPAAVEPKALGKFSITFYYVIGEEEVVTKKPPAAVAANDNEVQGSSDSSLATVAPAPARPTNVTVFADGCKPIAEVSREFALQLEIQGTGKLRDGRVLNVSGRCACDLSPCFKVTQAQWGTGGNGHALQPFRTVAVDPKMIKLGALLYVPLLEGRQMPGRAPWGGFIHDGCVVADDVGGGIKDKQLDLFVGRKGWFLGMSGSGGSHEWARNVPVFDGSQRCQLKGRQVSRRAGAI